MPKQYRLRIRGKQRDDLDLDLLAQALVMLSEDLQADRDQQGKEESHDDQPGEQP